MTEQKIIDKIDKLLQMTTDNGCTEEEAAAAAVKASKLLFQHNLTMADVLRKASDDNVFKAERDTSEFFNVHATAYKWQIILASGVAAVTSTRVLYVSMGRSRKAIRLNWYGLRDNIDVAKRMFQFLVGEVVPIGQTAKRIHVQQGGKATRTWLPSYYMGMAVRISDRLREQQEEQKRESEATGNCALAIISDELDKYMRQNVRAVRGNATAQTTSGDAYKAGYTAGGRVPLAPTSELPR